MKLNILKYFLLIVGLISLVIIYVSIIGLETDKFNDQIKKKFYQSNNELELKLKTSTSICFPKVTNWSIAAGL